MATEQKSRKTFRVVDGPVAVRSEPGGQWIAQLPTGQQIEVDANSRRDSGGYVWWRHSGGWSAERSADSSRVFLVEAAAPAAATRVFTVTGGPISVRSVPGLNGQWVAQLANGQQIEVDANSRREMDGYVWWQHSGGWSAERSLDGTKTYLTEATSAGVQPTSLASAPTPSQTKRMKVGVQQVRVRSAPGLKGAMVKWIPPGTLLDLDAGSRQEVDGFIWWKHAEGWSAERSVDGTQVFLVNPDADISLPETSTPAGLPDVNALPLRDALFKRFPVDLDKTLWWQYYGNNNFAHKLWAEGKQWYKYAQGLHGGLDFGNSNAPGVLVYAGIEGQFVQRDTQYTRPNGLWVRAGDYTVIYGHLTNPRAFNPGDAIAPETVMGEIEFGGQNHLHLEIRYKDRWIVNPLLFFTETMRNDIVKKFPPGEKYFYRDATWNQWQTPLDQPVIVLGGRLIGPHAR